MSKRTWSNFLNLIQIWNSDTEVAVNVVVSAAAKVQQNRNIPIVAQAHPGDGTTNVADWTPEEDIHSVVIPPNMRYVINIAVDADAKTALDDAGGKSVKVVYDRTYNDSLVYSQVSAITKLDLRSFSGADQANVTIGAWS